MLSIVAYLATEAARTGALVKVRQEEKAQVNLQRAGKTENVIPA